MSFSFLPNKIIKGKTSDGKGFEAVEYDYKNYILMESIGFFYTLFACFFISSISAPIILVMLMLNFTNRFNIIGLVIPILAGYFIYDCTHGWYMSMFMGILIPNSIMMGLLCMNIATITAYVFMVIFTRPLFNYIVKKVPENEGYERYIMLFFIIGIVFTFAWVVASHHVDPTWLEYNKIFSNP